MRTCWSRRQRHRGCAPSTTDKLPADLRTRPSTSLAFEFLDQPFLLDLEVESSPPLVKADSKTLFRIDADRARSETTIELDWVRGRLSELELGVAAGLQLISVGPPEVVESSHLSDEILSRGSDGPNAAAPAQGSFDGAWSRLEQSDSRAHRPPADFHRRKSEPGIVHAPPGNVGERLLRPGRRPGPRAGARGRLGTDQTVHATPLWSPTASKRVGRGHLFAGTRARHPCCCSDDGNSRFLPIRITRHARTIVQDTVLSAQVSRRWVDLLGRATFAVRHGVVSSLEVRVPAVIADRWELLEKELVDREELGRDPDGVRRYRLSFARPVVDKATLRFRYRLPLVPGLDAKSVREITIPEISFKDVSPGPTKVEMSLTPEIVLKETDKAWARSSDDVRVEPAGEGALISFEEGDPSSRKLPFTFKALALEPVPLPSFVVPRLLLKTVSGGDDSIRSSALYWVESHGPDFPFALPEGARWIGARVDGRLAEQVDYDPSRVSYRLRFPGEVGSRPVLVELEYQLSEQVTKSKWPAPRLLDGGVVLQTLWEVRAPCEQGPPRRPEWMVR